jgi:hypothetical protein
MTFHELLLALALTTLVGIWAYRVFSINQERKHKK